MKPNSPSVRPSDRADADATAAEASQPAPTAAAVDPDWAVIEEGFTLAREREIESIMTISNGYVGSRGSLSERTSRSAPATFLAGVFETEEGGASLELVALPDWTHLSILVDGAPLSLERGDMLAHRRTLDLRHGLLRRTWRHRDPAGRVTSLEFVRLVSLADRHLLLHSVSIEPENYDGTIIVESCPAPPHGRTRWQSRTEGEAVISLATTTRGVSIATALTSGFRAGSGRRVERALDPGSGEWTERWTWRAERGDIGRFDRLAVVYTSRETHDPAAEAGRDLQRARQAGAATHVRDHTNAWEERWRSAGVCVVGDEAAQRALRFAVHHLVAVANPDDERVSVGARALSGRTYKGHVFWDTEIYVLPFYTWTHPAAARSLLMYRYHTLAAARARARRLGYGGALFAWESADTGDDVTPDYVLGPDGRPVRVLTGLQEHHISADVAYGVWQYWQATGDEVFFTSAGVEIILETARFWATRGAVESDGRYHIRAVIGPDEYHENVDDNAFTNVMAQWNLERAAEAAEWLLHERPDVWRTLTERLGIRPDEPAVWRRLADLMATGFDPRTNLFEQYHGFFQLEDVDLAPYRGRTRPIDVVLGRERTQRSQIVKQADVVALSALLWERYPRAVHDANFRYYEPRTGHGSSLSPALHALVSARLGDPEQAGRYWRDAAAVDLANGAHNGEGGIHIAALGGLWQAAVFGMAGVRLREDGLVFDPQLPSTWNEWSFSLQWRGRSLAVSIRRDPGRIAVELLNGGPMIIELVRGNQQHIGPRRRYIADRTAYGWDVWRETAL